MARDLDDLAALRAAVTLSPPTGAKERVLRSLVVPNERRGQRPLRVLILVLATLVATTAAALGVSMVPRWVGRHFALAAGAHAPTPAPRPTSAPHPHRSAPRAEPESPVPGPDLPVIPPATTMPVPQPAASPRPSAALEAAPNAGGESLLAQQVAAFREASSLVETSPGLAIVRLRAFQERWPASPLGEEAAVRLVQALVALGRDADARAHASAFIVRYPASRRRAEMEALVSGARPNRSNE